MSPPPDSHVTDLLARLSIDIPLVQAGMAGGIAGHELAAAVSDAGGLGTIGTLEPAGLRAEIEAARRLTGKPLAVNLLLPFAVPEHYAAAGEADVVVTFWGEPKRRVRGVWIHQCGSAAEARAAHAAGADAVIAQGLEAGGHVRGGSAALSLLADIREALPDGYPVLLAGGIATREDVERALSAGAVAAVAGTRFVMSEESRAHPAYKERLREADTTVVTELFGLGWADAPHRVVANEATRRWLRRGSRGPAALRLVNRALSPGLGRLPAARQRLLANGSHPRIPLLSALPPTVESAAKLVEAAPLYAGETVARIDTVLPAAQIVRDLAPAARRPAL